MYIYILDYIYMYIYISFYTILYICIYLSNLNPFSQFDLQTLPFREGSLSPFQPFGLYPLPVNLYPFIIVHF